MSHQLIRSLRTFPAAVSLCGVLVAPAAVMAAPFAYVPGNLANDVTVIDTATDTVVGTIPVGVNPQHVAVHPVAPRVYVTHERSLSVIDAERRVVAGTVALGAPVSSVVVHPAGTEIYVALATGAVAVVDAATLVPTATIDVGGVPAGLGLHPSGATLYVANGNVVVVDTARRTVTATLVTGSTPVRWLAVHPGGTRLYALDGQSDRVVAIDTATHAVTGTVAVPAPAGAALDPSGGRLYVTSSAQHSLSVVETTTLSVTATVSLGAGAQPMGVAVLPSGQRVYVANSLLDTVAVVDAGTLAVVRSIAVGRYPVALGPFIAPWDPAGEGDDACGAAEARIVELEAELAAAHAAGDGDRATIHSLVLRVFGGPVDAHAALAARDVAEAQVDAAIARVGSTHRRVVQATRHLEAGRAALTRGNLRAAVRAFDQAFDTASTITNPRGTR